MNKAYSIKKQKEAGTYERNQAILRLAQSGVRKATIARRYSLSRERIGQIVKRGDKTPVGFFSRLKRIMLRR